MSSKKLIIIVMAVLVTGLSSCAKKGPNLISNEAIRQEIVTQFKVDDATVKLNELTTESNKIKDLHSTVKVKVVLENDEAISTLDVMLYYTYSNNKWAFVSKTTTPLSAILKSQPDIAEVTDAMKALVNDGSYLNVVNTGSFHEDSDMVNTSIQPANQSGWILYTFESTYSILDTTAVGTTIIKARYVYDKGWEYTTDSWSYIEKTKLDGDYIYTFGVKTGTEDSWFSSNQILQIQLEGTMTLTVKSDGTTAYDNDITGTMTSESITKTLSAAHSEDSGLLEPSSTLIKLIFGTESDAFLTLLFDDGTDHGGDASPAQWYGVDAHDQYFSIKRVN
jgi:hypothetical protein